jgi:outer membrane phospholipase A
MPQPPARPAGTAWPAPPRGAGFALLLAGAALMAEESAPAPGATPAPADTVPAAPIREEGAVKPAPAGHGRFWQRISAYEPTYALVEPVPGGNREVNVKFQLSVAFQLIGRADGEPVPGDDRADGLYTTFSQTSFWDLGAESKPFVDSSYRVDVFWHQGLTPGFWGSDGLALEGGLGHESNGKAGEESRSFNTVFIRPVLRWELGDGWWVKAGPRFHSYLGTLSENPEIGNYRGHANLDVSLGIRDGLMLMLRGRVGDELNRGSIEADLSYPLDRLSGGWLHGFIFVQSFTGYSESLLADDQLVAQPRILVGLAITR